MKRTTTATIALLLLTLAGDPTDGGEKQRKKKDPGPSSAAVDKAMKRSIGWLDRHLFKLSEAGGTPTKPFTYATAGLVHLMVGTPKTSGVAVDPVEDIKDYLTDYVATVARRARDLEELPPRQGHFSSRYLIQYTWPVAQAGLFFSELHVRGRWPRESRKTLLTIKALLVEARADNGGWGHHRVHARELAKDDPIRRTPLGADAGSGYPSTLVASTNCVATTLGVIEAVLGRGTAGGLDRTRRYFHKSRLADGNYPYDPSQRSAGTTGVSRAGGAIMAMHFLGIPHEDADLSGSRTLLLERLRDASEAHGSSMLGLTYSAIALRLLGDEGFAKFRKMYFPRILAHQAKEGNFTCVCEKRHMATSCDDPRPGLPGTFARTKEAYTSTLMTFILLLDRNRLKILAKKPVPAPAKGEITKFPRRKR